MREKNIIEQYIGELQQGNQEHIDELYTYCNEYLNKVAYSRNYTFSVAWDKEDFISEVITRVLLECKNYDTNRGCFNTWISMLANSVYCKGYDNETKENTISYWGKNRDGKEYNIVDGYTAEDSCEDKMLFQFEHEEIITAIESLKENYRMAIQLCIVDEYKVAKAARIIGCKSDDISRWLFRGKEALVKQLKCAFELERDDYDRE